MSKENRKTNKSKSNKKRKVSNTYTINENIKGLLFILLGLLFLLSLSTGILGGLGKFIRYMLLGQIGKLSFVISLISIAYGFLTIRKFNNKDLNKITIILCVGAVFLYGSMSFGVVFPQKVDINLIKTVFVQSVIGENIGVVNFLVTNALYKFIGKVGMFLISVGLFLFLFFKYSRYSFTQVSDNVSEAISSSYDKVSDNFKNVNKKIHQKIQERNGKQEKSEYFNENFEEEIIKPSTTNNDRFDFMSRYKDDIQEFNSFVESQYEDEIDLKEDTDILENTDFSVDESNKIYEDIIESSVDNENIIIDDAVEFVDDEEDKYIIHQKDDNISIDSEYKTTSNNVQNEEYKGETKIFSGLKSKIVNEIENIDDSYVNYEDNRIIHEKNIEEKENLDSLVIEDLVEVKAENKKQYTLPNESLLKKYSVKEKNKEKEIKNIEKLESTLKIFGVDAKVMNVAVGPTITRYELQPKMGVKVSKILNLSDDLSLALAAVAPIRIEAPIPGTSLIGIEVPNPDTDVVSFRDMIESNDFKNSKYKLPFTLGKDVSGRVIVQDIASMPHVLVAGSTGSGKSVCINTLICSVLFKSSPDDVKMIMIDPKMVELSVYNDIPHLLVPVVTDMKKAPYALSWAVNEMNNRYKLLAENRVRDIEGYNEINPDNKMPRIIVVVDELADLMMVSPNEVEDAIIRLAQKARAAGMHLVIATQRPSVDVITGLIKANIPTRIAFAVSSQIDSRTILDQSGAEKLIGRGDMLFSHPSSPKPQRIQGPFVTDEEVNAIVDFISNQKIENRNEVDIIEDTIKKQEQIQKTSEKDEILDDVIEFVKQNKEISTSLIQRRFRIGYNRASRIIDELEMSGIISESNGAKARKVLVTSTNTDIEME